MLRTVPKIIYILVLVLYIFSLSAIPVGNNLTVVKNIDENSTYSPFQRTETKYKLNTFSQTLGVKNLLNPEQFSIHSYEDDKYNEYRFIDEGNKQLSQSDLAAYSYHRNSYNNKEVLGFLPYWALAKYQEVDYSKLSTIAYFGLTSDSTGRWINNTGYTAFFSASFDNMVQMAHAKGTKVVVVAKNFDPYSIRRIINNVDGAGDRLINNIYKAIRDNNLDGVNVDFEYVVKSPSDTITDDLRAKFASWHDKLADTIHTSFPKSHVSTDVFGGSGIYYNLYDMEALGNTSLNYIVMMTYDYITTSCYNGKIVTPMSPLYGNEGYNISTHLLAGAQKAGSKKVIMGVPYYGIDFQVKSADRDLYNARVDYPNCDGTIETYASIVDPKFDQFHNSNTLKWNSSEKARWYSYTVDGKYRHGYYDDAKSLGYKYDFVNSSSLGGIGIWALGYDNNAKELYDVIRDKFQKAPFYVQFGLGVTESKITSILSVNNLEVVSQVGINLYLVQPESELSAIVMKRIKVYSEVLDSRFEIINSVRSIN